MINQVDTVLFFPISYIRLLMMRYTIHEKHCKVMS